MSRLSLDKTKYFEDSRSFKIYDAYPTRRVALGYANDLMTREGSIYPEYLTDVRVVDMRTPAEEIRLRYGIFVAKKLEEKGFVSATIPMSEKEIREARRANIPEFIIGKMMQGFGLTENEKEILKRKGKVYVRAFKKDRGQRVIKPQIRDIPKR